MAEHPIGFMAEHPIGLMAEHPIGLMAELVPLGMQGLQNYRSSVPNQQWLDGTDFHPNMGMLQSLGPAPMVQNMAPTYLESMNQGEASGSIKNPMGAKRKRWTTEEDRFLKNLIAHNEHKTWTEMAKQMPGKTGKQLRERFENQLRPDIKMGPWTEDEEAILNKGHIELGNKWVEIAKRIPGRTENSVKNHFHSYKRQLKVSSNNTGCSSMLKNYIRSLPPKNSVSSLQQKLMKYVNTCPNCNCTLNNSLENSRDTNCLEQEIQMPLLDLDSSDMIVIPGGCTLDYSSKDVNSNNLEPTTDTANCAFVDLDAVNNNCVHIALMHSPNNSCTHTNLELTTQEPNCSLNDLNPNFKEACFNGDEMEILLGKLESPNTNLEHITQEGNCRLNDLIATFEEDCFNGDEMESLSGKLESPKTNWAGMEKEVPCWEQDSTGGLLNGIEWEC